MNILEPINIYPVTLRELDNEIASHKIESLLEHATKIIEYNLANMDELNNTSQSIHKWLENMPHIDAVPSIKTYQEKNKKDVLELELDFQKIKVTLPLGQELVRKAQWPDCKNELILKPYSSTSLYPSYSHGVTSSDDAFIIIKIMSPNIKFYFFDPFGDGWDEAEVLVGASVKLIKKESYKIKNNYNDEFSRIIYAEAFSIP